MKTPEGEDRLSEGGQILAQTRPTPKPPEPVVSGPWLAANSTGEAEPMHSGFQFLGGVFLKGRPSPEGLGVDGEEVTTPQEITFRRLLLYK